MLLTDLPGEVRASAQESLSVLQSWWDSLPAKALHLGVRVLLAARRQMERQGRMQLLGVGDAVRQKLEIKGLADAFGLPEYMIPVMMLGLGYPNDRAKAHQAHFDREPVGNFVTEL